MDMLYLDLLERYTESRSISETVAHLKDYLVRMHGDDHNLVYPLRVAEQLYSDVMSLEGELFGLYQKVADLRYSHPVSKSDAGLTTLSDEESDQAVESDSGDGGQSDGPDETLWPKCRPFKDAFFLRSCGEDMPDEGKKIMEELNALSIDDRANGSALEDEPEGESCCMDNDYAELEDFSDLPGPLEGIMPDAESEDAGEDRIPRADVAGPAPIQAAAGRTKPRISLAGIGAKVASIFGRGADTELEAASEEVTGGAASVEERQEVFLNGYIRPFRWRCWGTQAEFLDQVGCVIKIESDSTGSRTIHRSIIGPLADKLCAILNGEETDPDEFPRFFASFTKDLTSRININGFYLAFQDRNGTEGNVRNELLDYVVEKTFSDEDIRLVDCLRSTSIQERFWCETLARIRTGKYPYYNYMPGYTVEDEETDMTDLLLLESFVRNGFADEEVIRSSVPEILREFHQGLEASVQASESARLAVARKLNSLTGETDPEKDSILALKLGVIRVDDEGKLLSLQAFEKWSVEHLLRDGDYEVERSDWDKGVFLLTKNRQLGNFDRFNVKYRNGNCFSWKISYLMYDWQETIIRRLNGYYNDNLEGFDPDAGLIFPLPAYNLSSRDTRTIWLQMNLFLLGVTVQKTPITEYLKGFDIQVSNGGSSSKGFRKSMKNQFEELIREKGTLIDSTLKFSLGNFVIPGSVFDSFCEVLEQKKNK